MQNPSPFSSPPPIPTPDGNFPSVPQPQAIVDRSNWKTAPVIVKGWAYPLTWLLIAILSVGIFASLMFFGRNQTNGASMLIIFALLFSVAIWLNRGLKNGVYATWIIQLIYSGLVVVSFPIALLSREGNPVSGLVGLAIHGYILSQWFKPETKAWFGKS